MARMVDTYVKCPFYEWEDGIRLCCEGVFENTKTQTLFDDKPLRRMYERKFCKRDWDKCPLAQALEKKHDQA